MDVTMVLMSAQSPDPAQRKNAEQLLQQAEETNLMALMQMLAMELVNEGKDVNVRQLAGLTMKNCLTGKEDRIQAIKRDRWLALPESERSKLKGDVMRALGSEVQKIRQTTAQVISAIALIELPAGQWTDLVPTLTGEVMKKIPETTKEVKEAVLETIGYICEEIDPQALEAHSNAILTAVVSGMRPEEDNAPSVRLKATQALYNTMEFIKVNFENEAERNYIMQTLCETTQVENLEIKIAAYEDIVRVAELYYDKLPAYMQALYGLTTELIKKANSDHNEDMDALGRQAIEFWTTICEEELELIDTAREEGTQPTNCHNFIKNGVAHLVPLLLNSLCLQDPDEDPEDDNWNMAQAAAVCLTKIALTIGDDVVEHVMPFMQQHIKDPDWRRREAATLAFGSILEGPAEQKLGPIVAQGMDVLIEHMNDQALQVKDTAAWAIARVFEHQPRSITNAQLHGLFQEETGVLLVGLRDDPRVANNVCVALHNLAEQCEESKDEATNPLSQLFIGVARALLQCTERPDAAANHLRIAAYEALNSTISNAAQDTLQHIEQILPLIITRLEQSFSLDCLSSEDREAQSELQGLLCGVLQVITIKLEEKAKPFSEKLMDLFLQVFGSKNQTVHEEALMAVAAIANLEEAGFERHMPRFRPFLSMGLSNSAEYQVCQVAVGVVGDICRALEARFEPYCDELVKMLFVLLQDTALKRDVKPPILSCFGDIALALGGAFEKYLQLTMTMLQQAQETPPPTDPTDQDMADYVDTLREGILEAFTGILQGLRAGEKADRFHAYVDKTLEFLGKLANELHPEHRPPNAETPSDAVLRAAVGVIGDLASALGPAFKQSAKQTPHKEVIKFLLKQAKASSNEQTKQVAQWVYKELG